MDAVYFKRIRLNSNICVLIIINSGSLDREAALSLTFQCKNQYVFKKDFVTGCVCVCVCKTCLWKFNIVLGVNVEKFASHLSLRKPHLEKEMQSSRFKFKSQGMSSVQGQRMSGFVCWKLCLTGYLRISLSGIS